MTIEDICHKCDMSRDQLRDWCCGCVEGWAQDIVHWNFFEGIRKDELDCLLQDAGLTVARAATLILDGRHEELTERDIKALRLRFVWQYD